MLQPNLPDDSSACFTLTVDDDVTTCNSSDENLWLYLYFSKPCFIKTLQNGKPACYELPFQVILTSE